MSRIGNKPIEIPQEVEINLDNNKIQIKGPKGVVDYLIHEKIIISKSDKEIIVTAKSKDKFAHSLQGLTRSLIANMITGVTKGYTKKLEVIGVGYRVQLQGSDLILNVGFSHPVTVKAPEGITFALQKNTITISGIDKQLVGEISAQIRKIRKPEPYKGKGIRYQGEEVKRKPGKAAKTGTTSS